MPYCTQEDVGAELRKTFTASTNPSDNMVSEIVEEVSAEIDSVLSKAGYSLPISDLALLSVLKAYNRYGASARVDSLIFGDAKPGESSRSERLYKWYQEGLKKIMGEALSAGWNGAERLPISYSTENSDKLSSPLFTRDMTP